MQIRIHNKDINVKVTQETHQRLMKILHRQPEEWPDVARDFGDVVERVLDFWEKNHKER